MGLGFLRVFPDPFKEVVNIKYQVRDEEPVSLQIYNTSGRLVRTLVRTQNQEPRAYELK